MPKKRRKMKNKEQQLEDKIKKIKEGCGFQNSYKQICGKTPKKKTDKRDKYLIYLCMRCMSKMGIIKRQINLIQEGKKLKEDEDLKIMISPSTIHRVCQVIQHDEGKFLPTDPNQLLRRKIREDMTYSHTLKGRVS
jgi:hypothetical protein